MPITRDLFLEMLTAAYMQRWNDKLRPVELLELDKQAHKMILAFFLGSFHAGEPGFSWPAVIEGGWFEFLQRIVVTDLKPQIFDQIKQDREKYEALNAWVGEKLRPLLDPLGGGFTDRFLDYFQRPESVPDINRRILGAAHVQATQWEFDLLRGDNTRDYELDAIRLNLEEKRNRYADLRSVQQLEENVRYQGFTHLCGQLRFQIRWSRIHRVPRTSVLGHLLFVAILAYLLSREAGLDDTRCVNNYFTGLFHDLPEALTRDIISPVKRSVAGLESLIKDYEQREMRRVYRLLPEAGSWSAADKFAAYVEAYEAIRNGSPSLELREAMTAIAERWSRERICGLPLAPLFASFEECSAPCD